MEKDNVASIFCLIYCAFHQEMYPEDNDIVPTSQKQCSRRPKEMLPEDKSITLRVGKQCSQRLKAMLLEGESIALELTKHCSRTCRALLWSIKSIVLEHAELYFGRRKRMMTTIVAKYC